MVKISDVAQHAGVSPSTVSYVLSGKRTISPETKERVWEAITALGYRPHAGARALASSRSNVVALVLPLRTGIHVPVVMQFAISVVTAAREHDHDVLLLTQQEGEEGLRRVSASSLVDGVLVMDVQLHDERLAALRSLDRPAVLIGMPADTTGLTCVDLDFTAAGAACVDHLANLGHRQVALIGSPPEVYARETGFAERVEHGFLEAARQRGMDSTAHPCAPTAEAVEELLEGLLHERPDLTSLVVHNEPLVEPAIRALRQVGRSVPEEISVVAICPDEVAERAPLPVTSVRIPAEELGHRAVDLLMTLLDDGTVPETTLLPAELTVRASTAPARAPKS
ncbi:LacI family DNA-binding transcriptional regulator [Nocardioides astragali]|uniref:LacI family DNA-binding transcriptional regulator n=1 Tax=Nocardioides astragali TaxID=1776736 RepID=A0ABW2N4M7_9ACTN|nr:LacI family DNA-binding transcriptional regulator [Nocardioides astragali]